MCFAKTNALYWDIDEVIRKQLPLQIYAVGCHVISVIAAKILNKYGYIAKARLVGMNSRVAKTMVPHWVVIIKVGEEYDQYKTLMFWTSNAAYLEQETVWECSLRRDETSSHASRILGFGRRVDFMK
jgi:hypothetical protein